jgi:hypothetical protein
MGAIDILAELEEIGVFGDPPVPKDPPKDLVKEVTLDRAAPSTVLRDSRGPNMVVFCERAIELLEDSIRSQQELQELFAAVRDIWSDDGEQLEEASDEPEEEGTDDSQEEEPEASEDTDDVEVTASEEEAHDSEWPSEVDEEAAPVSESAVAAPETANAILDFYAENEAAGAPLGVEEDTGSKPASFEEGRSFFMATLKAEAERGV